MAMSQARFKQIYSGLSSQAAKVYDHVPIEEEWSASEIATALTRANIGMAFNVISGCLNSLKQAGLIAENKAGCWRREKVRAPYQKRTLADLGLEIKREAAKAAGPAPTLPNPTVTPKEPEMTKPEESLVDRLGSLAQMIAATAERHQGEMRDLANLVSDMAIEVQAQEERFEKDLGQWRQMQALLKGMTS